MEKNFKEAKWVVHAVELHASGLTEQVTELREGTQRDCLLIFDMLRRMEEMQMQMNLLLAQNVGQAPLVDLTIHEAPDVLGSPLSLGSPARVSSPPGIGWLQRVSVTLQAGDTSLRVVEELVREWLNSEKDGSPELS